MSPALRPVRRGDASDPDKNERYTLASTERQCRHIALVPRWDLDVAACAESHLAGRYFTKQDNGLKRDWSARFVWCNPPWDKPGPWARKAWREMARRRGPETIGMLLPGGRTEQPWWQDFVEPHRDGRISRVPGVAFTTHNLPGRVKFGSPGNLHAVGTGSPPFTCVFLVFTRRRA